MSIYSQVKKEELNLLSFIFPKYNQYLAFVDFLRISEVENIFNDIVKMKVIKSDTTINKLCFLNNNVCVTRFTNSKGQLLMPENVIQTILPNNELPLNMLSIYSWMAWQFRIDVNGLSQSCFHHNENKVFLLPSSFKGLTNNNDRLLVDPNTGLINFSSNEIKYLLEKDNEALEKIMKINEKLKIINKLFVNFKKDNYLNIFDDDNTEYGIPYYYNVDDYKKYLNKNEFFLSPFNKATLPIENYSKITKKIVDDFMAKEYSLVEVKEYLDFLNKQVPESHDIFKNKNYKYMSFSASYDSLLKMQKNINYKSTDVNNKKYMENDYSNYDSSSFEDSESEYAEDFTSYYESKSMEDELESFSLPRSKSLKKNKI